MALVNLEVSESQVIDLVRQLSVESKRAVLLAMVPEYGQLDSLVDRGEKRIREICTRRGVDWDLLSEAERLALIDDLVHES